MDALQADCMNIRNAHDNNQEKGQSNVDRE
jgi:hypothetical protein